MEQRALWARLPHRPPFDNERYFASFVGSFVIPLLATNQIGRFWFTQYGEHDTPFHQVRFRFEVDDFASIEPQYNGLVNALGLEVLENDPFDIVGDFSGPRFLGVNQRRTDYRNRGEMVFDFLHASARLYVDCLSHCDEKGYWFAENNQDLGNNDKGNTIETFHHLFCNMTDVPTEVVVAVVQETGARGILSRLYFKNTKHDYASKGQTLVEVHTSNVKF